MRYSQGQARHLLDLPVETLRHWRKVLPPLHAKHGRAASFAFSDLIALGVLKRISETFGIPIGRMADASVALFDECEGLRWSALATAAFTFDGQAGRIVDISALSFDEPNLILPLQPILTELRARLLQEGPDDQPSLRFPPLPLKSRNSG